jgi:transposase-like protein
MDTSEQTTIETVTQVKRRRRSIEEKRRIVEETLGAGASVARVAQRHAINSNQVLPGARGIVKGNWEEQQAHTCNRFRHSREEMRASWQYVCAIGCRGDGDKASERNSSHRRSCGRGGTA